MKFQAVLIFNSRITSVHPERHRIEAWVSLGHRVGTKTSKRRRGVVTVIFNTFFATARACYCIIFNKYS